MSSSLSLGSAYGYHSMIPIAAIAVFAGAIAVTLMFAAVPSDFWSRPALRDFILWSTLLAYIAVHEAVTVLLITEGALNTYSGSDSGGGTSKGNVEQHV